jgi:hypothetical protein
MICSFRGPTLLVFILSYQGSYVVTLLVFQLVVSLAKSLDLVVKLCIWIGVNFLLDLTQLPGSEW